MGNDNCVFKDDDFYEIFEKIKEADGLILGSPVYGVDISAEMKIFLDRLGLASIGNPDALRHKPGAAVCAVHRAGGMNTVNTMNNVMHLDFTYDVMDMMSQIRESWGLKYPEEM